MSRLIHPNYLLTFNIPKPYPMNSHLIRKSRFLFAIIFLLTNISLSAQDDFLYGDAMPDAAELLSGEAFEEFINKAKKEFDYIIVDTAPTLLVADTLLISESADLTLFVARVGFTDKRSMEFSKGLNNSKKLYNMAYVLNDVGLGKAREYNYGHGYGYSSQE